MGKVDINKKQKKNALLQTAFDLFRDKGFAKTTISDIVSDAGLAKGTFYLYFKDKYDLRDKLIAHKASHPLSGLPESAMHCWIRSLIALKTRLSQLPTTSSAA